MVEEATAKKYAMRSCRIAASLALLAGCLLPATAQGPAPGRYSQTHPAMGTVFTLELYAPDAATADRATTLAFDEVDRLEALLTNYRPTSELSRINREAVAGPVTTDPETFAFLERSMAWSRASNGAFDLTVGPLLRAWGFFFHAGHVPDPATLASLRDRVGWQHVELDPATRSVAFAGHRALELDPGSIGKGFAVDSVVRLLRAQGVHAALLSAGGSTVYALGAPPGEAGWPVTVPDPRGGPGQTLLLRDTSLSTGACTQKFFVQAGHRYCHIFNPQTLRPMEDVLQSSVIDPSATDSDALSTVVFVLPPAATRHLLAARRQTQVLVFRANGGCESLHWPGAGCGQSMPPASAEPDSKQPNGGQPDSGHPKTGKTGTTGGGESSSWNQSSNAAQNGR